MPFGYSCKFILSNDTQLKGENMKKPTPQQQGLWTYSMLQRRKERTKKAEQRGDIEAEQVLITGSITARNKYYKSKLR